MAVLARSVPQIPVVLASLLLWFSFAWGLPAEAPAAEGEAEVAAEDPWAGVKISDAYDYAKCPRCGHKNDIRAERCSGVTWWVSGGNRLCGYELPQPSGEYTYPPWVFVPGLGYYREGTLLEPGKSRKGYWITGLVIGGLGLTFLIAVATSYEGSSDVENIAGFASAGGMTIVGAVLFIVGRAKRTEPVYAFTRDEYDELFNGRTYALRSPDSDGAAIKVEVTLLGF